MLPALALMAGASARADEAGDARRSFDLGSKLYAEGAVREALAAFELSYRASPRASSLQNVAQCHRDLKEFGKAYAAYEQLLHTFGASLKPDKREAARTALGELAKVTGGLRVALVEPGVRVTIDDAEAGATPLAPLRLGVGPHTLAASKSGFRTLKRAFEIKGGDEVTVDGPLERDVPIAPSPAPSTEPPAPPRAEVVPAPLLAPPVTRIDAGAPASGRMRRTLGFVGIGTGAAGIIAGAVAGAVAIGQHGALVKECPTGTCYGAARDDLGRYHATSAASTAGFVAGGALGVAGVVLVATAPSSTGGSVEARLGLSSFVLSGRFR